MKAIYGAGLGLAFFMASCAGNRVNLIETGAVSLVKIDPVKTAVTSGKAAYVSEVRAYRDGEDLVVSGRVIRHFASPIPVHVDVAVYGPDGSLLAAGHSGPFSRSMRRGVPSGRSTPSYGLRRPRGAIVKVSIHSGRHEDEA